MRSNLKARLIDSHCHLDFPQFEGDLAAVIAQAQDKGVEKFVVPACGTFNWQKVVAISKQYDAVYYALGLYPYFMDKHSESDIQLLDAQLAERSDKCVAVGECGLDFFVEQQVKGQQQQIELLAMQLMLANKHHLPVIIHCRKAQQTMVKLLKQANLTTGGVIHGFSGSYQEAMDYIKLGYYIGVGSTITYLRAKKTRQTISKLPLRYLVLETDAPDMPLNGYQGQKNRPERVAEVLNELILLRSESEQTVAEQVFENSKTVFTNCE